MPPCVSKVGFFGGTHDEGVMGFVPLVGGVYDGDSAVGGRGGATGAACGAGGVTATGARVGATVFSVSVVLLLLVL